MESGFRSQVTLPLDYDHDYGNTSKAQFHPVPGGYIYYCLSIITILTQLQLGGNTTQYKNIKLQKYKDRNRYTSGSQLHLGGKTGAIQK